MKLKMIVPTPNYANGLPVPTEAMVANFHTRTKHHISLVAKNLQYYIDIYDNPTLKQELEQRQITHDASKFEEPEIIPYIWLTEYHKQKGEGKTPEPYPPHLQAAIDQACYHHITTNSHHPEFHANINTMPLADILEMICDWTAMSEELRQGGSAKDWATKNIPSKWKFSKSNQKLIRNLIQTLDDAKK